MGEDPSPLEWRREGNRPWYWRSTLSFLTHLPDRSELLPELFRRHTHASLGGARLALDHLSYLVDIGEIPAAATVGDAIGHLKRLHRAGLRG